MPSPDPDPPAADNRPATILVALELARSSWLVAVHTPLADRISRHRLEAGDTRALLALIDDRRARIATACGQPPRVLSCYEAASPAVGPAHPDPCDGFWLHRLLEQHGVDNHVLDPASLLVTRRARRAKTDRLDLEGPLRTLMALARGEPRVASVVRVPTVAEVDARRLHRERHRLGAERVRHVNRIKALLATRGVDGYQPLARDRHARLGLLRTGDGRDLPPRLEGEIERELARLELVLAMLQEVEAERDAIVAGTRAGDRAADHPAAPKIRALAKLEGIGPELATVLAGEVLYRPVDNRRQLAAPVGGPCRPRSEPQPERRAGARPGHRQGR
jgi:transposase